MKLVTNKATVLKLLAEILSEYIIYEKEGEEEAPAEEEPAGEEGGGEEAPANPFAAAAAAAGGEEEGGEEGGEEGEAAAGEEKDDKGGKKGGKGGSALSIEFDRSAVKRYNDTQFRVPAGEVKSITKDGLEVAVDGGGTVHVNFQDITNEK